MSDSKYLNTGKLDDCIQSRKFEDYVYTLMCEAYSEIKDRTVRIEWGRATANAVIIWSQNKIDIIRCNRAVRNWPEPVLYGLLSHELSHIALGANLHLEIQADRDVIDRGLGPYLAIERLYTNKHSDHILREGEDRYLGYMSIRKLLSSDEVHKLEGLMLDLRMS
ncbi:MAG: hypothetical protein ACTSQZ_06970 [Candidatus Thorarchaeota archaeon]